MNDRLQELIGMITDADCDIVFTYAGKTCGIVPEVNDSIPVYTMWFGDIVKEYDDINEMMSDRVFDGKSLLDIGMVIDVENS